MSRPRPPRLAEWLLATQVWPDERPIVLGDFDEQFQRQVQATGAWRSTCWYWRRAIQLVFGLWWWTPRPAWSRGRVMAMDDVRYAVRRLRKQPLTALVSIATLACAIGAAAATWSLISAVLLHPLRVHEPERLVEISYRRETPRGPQTSSGFTYPASRLLREAGFMPAAAWGSIGSQTPLMVQAAGEPRERSVRFATPDFLSVLGLQPSLGRFFSDAEDRPGEPLVVVLSERFWQSEFNSDPGVIGRTIQVRGQPARIVGVAPRKFVDLDLGRAPALFMPLHSIDRVQPWEGLYGERPPVYWVQLVGRLPDGVSLAQMQDRMNALRRESMASLSGTTLVLTDVETAALSETSRADLRKFSQLLGSTVVLLLAIGSMTVGVLLLMRTEARRGEFAMCLALGASRVRLARGVAIEGVLLALSGALLALPVSRMVFAGIRAYRLPGGIRLDVLDLSLDGRVLAAAAGAAVASVVLIAGVASLFALRRDLGDVLRSHTGATPRLTRRHSRAALVTAQVAVTLVLVSGAGLFARSVTHALSLNPGFDTSRLLWGSLDLNGHGYDAARSTVFLDEFRTRLAQQPAVASFALSDGNQGTRVLIDGEQRDLKSVFLLGIDDRYLDTIGLPVLIGRNFTQADRAGAPRVGIVSASLAKAIAGDGSVLGRRISAPPKGVVLHETEIVGVIPDVIRGTTGLQPFRLYLPSAQYSAPVYPGSGGLRLLVRATGDVGAGEASVLATIRAIDPDIRQDAMTTIDAGILEEMAPQRFGTAVMGALGTIALLLSVLGTYVLAESMAVARRREMGIRAALGARGSHLRALLLSDTFRLVGAGLLLGFVLTWLGAGTIRAFLFQVEPFDPLVTGGVAATIITLTLAVSLRPALAAARIDLARVLRDD